MPSAIPGEPATASPGSRRSSGFTAYESRSRDPKRARRRSPASLAQEPEDERDHDRDHEPGDDREIEGKAVALDVDVARQPAEPELRDERPREPQDDQQNVGDDQPMAHYRRLPVRTAS